jgi:hypothetical protein
MASTYEPIATSTLGSAAASVTFSSISGTYTDLALVIQTGADSSAVAELQVQVNGDTGSNYSRTRITGSGSAAASAFSPSVAFMRFTGLAYLPNNNLDCNVLVNFMNYANTTTYKTVLSRLNHPAAEVNAIVNLWESTSAITSILVYPSTNNFKAGSTFTLYGIKAA